LASRTLNAAVLSLAALLLVTAVPTEAQLYGVVSYFGKNKITYREFDWKIYHSPHFDIYFYEDERVLLEKIVSLAESAYDRLSRQFDYQIQEPVPLIIYATHSAFEQNNIIVNFIPEGVGAFATNTRYRMVLPADLPDAELFQLVSHELTHIFQYEILFQGNLGKAVAVRPPLWVTEGMASYFGEDEQSWDEMYLRDAVVNDLIPPMTRANPQGFYAYRLGNALYEFVEARWGEEGLLDLIYELRNTFAAQVAPAVERAFNMERDEFDSEFRRWLRDRYLPALVETGEPSDYGRQFRAKGSRLTTTFLVSPAVSPSGDLLAAISTTRGEADVVLFDVPGRRQLRNLTRGYTSDYQYLVAQNVTVGRRMGSDLSFSPDGDTVAVFAKKESGRSLVLIDVLGGGHQRVIDLTEKFGVERQLSPTFSPDGSKVAFSAWRDGFFDIFVYDLETDQLTNLTDDDLYDGSPSYSPDGRWLVYSSVIDGYQKLFRIDLEDPSRRERLTRGESHERDAVHSRDGERLYFSSDQSGIENIYSVELATGEIVQHTNAVTGCMTPAVYEDREGRERMVYTGFWRQRFRLYVADPDEATARVAADADVREAEAEGAAGAGDEAGAEARAPSLMEFGIETATPEELPRFEPDIQVAVDEANEENYRGFKLALDDAQTVVAVDDDQTVLGQAILSFSDLIGDRRLITAFTSVRQFSDFDVIYSDRSRRLPWSVRLYDDRDFFLTLDNEGRINRNSLYRETGLVGSIWYPINLYHRVEVGGGYVYRDIDFPAFVRNRRTDEVFQVYEARTDDFPVVRAAVVGDTTQFEPWGPQAGRRYRLEIEYAPDLDESGTLSANYTLDARQYVPLTQRSSLAFRVYGAASNGNFRRPYWLGGLDTLRGLDIRSEVGDRVFFVNTELRFPLIDTLAFPFTAIRGIRGRFFLDVGGAWFGEEQSFVFWDGEENRLQDGLSSYGFGFSMFLFGLPVNWDFAQFWDFQDSEGGFRTEFWIGFRF
jgi:hypothetical protein